MENCSSQTRSKLDEVHGTTTFGKSDHIVIHFTYTVLDRPKVFAGVDFVEFPTILEGQQIKAIDIRPTIQKLVRAHYDARSAEQNQSEWLFWEICDSHIVLNMNTVGMRIVENYFSEGSNRIPIFDEDHIHSEGFRWSDEETMVRLRALAASESRGHLSVSLSRNSMI